VHDTLNALLVAGGKGSGYYCSSPLTFRRLLMKRLKVILALALALAMMMLSVAPALANDNRHDRNDCCRGFDHDFDHDFDFDHGFNSSPFFFSPFFFSNCWEVDFNNDGFIDEIEFECD
jgi:hypothetical protein